MRGMRNDVKDWLPARFEETTQLDEFRKHFKGGAFIVLSWDGCTGTLDDDRFRMFVDQFISEPSPSERSAEREALKQQALKQQASGQDVADVASSEDATPSYINEQLGLYGRQLRKTESERDFIGNRFDFYYTGDFHQNWAGLNEKWFRGKGGHWYYIIPNGNIFRWDENESMPASIVRYSKFMVTGKRTIKSTLVATPGIWDGPWFYKDPRRLEADLFQSVITGPSVLTDLTREGGALSGKVDLAKERLSGILFGPDNQQTCIFVTLNDRGRNDLHRVVGRGAMGRARGRLLRMAEQAGIAAPERPSPLPTFLQPFFVTPTEQVGLPEIRMGGPPIDNVAIDEEGQITLVRLVGLSILVGVTISWLNFRSWGVVLMLFLVGVIAAIFSLSIVWWGNTNFDAVLMSMPSLVYVLGLSGAVHIANYYRDTVDQDGYPGDPDRAIALGWKPCAVAALTTAIGLASLATSDIVPIRKFGIFSALGVVFSLAVLFTFLPAGLSLWPPKGFETKRDKDQLGASERVAAFWNRIGRFAVRRNGLVTVVCLIVLAVTAVGVTKIRTSVQLLKLFDHRSKIISDYTWLETHLGKLVPMEVLIRVGPNVMRSSELTDASELTPEVAAKLEQQDKFNLNFLERMEISENIRRQIDARFGAGHGDITGTPMLATTFVPPMPASGGGFKRTTARGAYSRTLSDFREDINESDYFRIDDDDTELWRISLRLGALNNTDYGEFVEELKTAVEPVLTAYRYRDEILRRIDAGRNHEGFRGARVLLLGAPFGQSRFASQPTALPTGSPYAQQQQVDGAAESQNGSIDQEQIFAQTLVSLLRNAALDYRDWHDPDYELPEKFLDQLDDYECVVILQDDPRYDLPEISRRATIVDGRNCQFDPNSKNEQQSMTALQKRWPVAVSYTGLVPIVYKAQRTLLESLIRSTGWAFLFISIVMVILLRSPSAGMVSMIPNVFPVVVVFGLMGWSNALVDIGTMMTASVAMGVAVDDTIHFLTWFRRGLDQGKDRNAAIMLAYDRCATAMTQTTLIGGLGLAVFGLSTFMPTQRFGILMLLLMVAALVGDLVFLPAILAGPFGRVFNATGRKAQPSNPNSPSPPPISSNQPATEGPVPHGVNRPYISIARRHGKSTRSRR